MSGKDRLYNLHCVAKAWCPTKGRWPNSESPWWLTLSPKPTGRSWRAAN